MHFEKQFKSKIFSSRVFEMTLQTYLLALCRPWGSIWNPRKKIHLQPKYHMIYYRMHIIVTISHCGVVVMPYIVIEEKFENIQLKYFKVFVIRPLIPWMGGSLEGLRRKLRRKREGRCLLTTNLNPNTKKRKFFFRGYVRNYLYHL